MRGGPLFALAALVPQAALAQALTPPGPGAVKLAEMRTLKVAVTGGGSVTWQGGGCAPKAGQNSAICTVQMIKGRTIDASAKAAPGTRLDAWAGACTGAMSCVFKLDGDQNLVASFIPDLHRVRIAGPAGIDVTMDPTGEKFSCGPNAQYGKVCYAFFEPGTAVNVYAKPIPPGSELMGPGCVKGATRCRVSTDQDADLCVRPAGSDPSFTVGGAVVGGASNIPAGGCRIK